MRPTGLAGLDRRIGGGFAPGTVHLLVAAPMNAVEALCLQAAKAFERSKLFIAGPHLGDLEEATAQWDHVSVRERDPRKPLPRLEANTRHIIWSLTPFIEAQGKQAILPQLAQLRTQARKNGSDVLVVVEKDALDSAIMGCLASWADGVMELGFDRQGFGLYPFLQINKMRGVPGSACMILFKETDEGLFFESTRRVV